MTTIRQTNDLMQLIRREVAALECRYLRRLLLTRDPKRRFPPLRDMMRLVRPADK